MSRLPQRRFALHEPAIDGLRPPAPEAGVGRREAPDAPDPPDIGGVELAEARRTEAAGVPAAVAPFGDVPRWVWRVYLSAWAAIFGMFFLFFAVNAAAAFVVTIAGLFAVMAFGLPAVLAAQSTGGRARHIAIVHTHTGPLSATAAGTQIVLIPIGAVIGLLAFILLAA